MKTGFKGPLQPVKTEKKESTWDFRSPEYDERTGCYVNAGAHYGVGKTQPVGHKDGATLDAACLPNGRVETLQTRYGGQSNLPLDIKE